MPKNVVLAPIGGRYSLYGLWQPVKVVSHAGRGGRGRLRYALGARAATDRSA